MRIPFYIAGFLDLPKPVIVTISLSVTAVLMLAVFVFYMWRNQERSAEIAREVQHITNEIGAGIVDFIGGNNGYITYASKGFYTFLGFSPEEIKEQFGNGFYNLLEEPYSSYLKSTRIDGSFKLKEEMKIKTKWGTKWVIVSGNSVLRK